MTAATKNTLTLEELLVGEGSHMVNLNDVGLKSVVPGASTTTTQPERKFKDINFVMGTDMLPIAVPSCFKARETVEWERSYEAAKAKLQTYSTLTEGVEALTLEFINNLAHVLGDVSDVNEWLTECLASTTVVFWSLADAMTFLSTGALIEEGNQNPVRLHPISENVFGSGGRDFVDDVWSLVVDTHAMGRAFKANATTAASKSKPAKKNAKRKAASKARKVSKKK